MIVRIFLITYMILISENKKEICRILPISRYISRNHKTPIKESDTPIYIYIYIYIYTHNNNRLPNEDKYILYHDESYIRKNFLPIEILSTRLNPALPTQTRDSTNYSRTQITQRGGIMAAN